MTPFVEALKSSQVLEMTSHIQILNGDFDNGIKDRT